jgi:glutathione S-transferase
VARERKWAWIQHGLAAPGVAEQLQIYVAHVRRIEQALEHGPWLAGAAFSMADVALAPYVNRLDALAMSGIWSGGRLPRVGDWFERVRARPAFTAAFLHWMPAALATEMRANGERAWPEVLKLLG